jgi:dephospho-CoA kinase
MKKKSWATDKNRLVGITGGIGAGKSVVARLFSQAGYPVLSADELARDLTAPNTPALREIAKIFGQDCILPDGSLDRGRLRSEISKEPALRKELEQLLHPLIQARSLELAEQLFQEGARLVFYEAPLLFEAKSDKKMDAVICVHAPDGLRVKRVMQRDGRPREEVESLLACQMPQEEKVRLSDYQILNDGDEAQLVKRAHIVLEELRKET